MAARIEKGNLRIVATLGAGAEGTVHRVTSSGGASMAYKEYAPEVLDERGDSLARKVQAMIANPPSEPATEPGHRTFIWPTAAIYEGNRFRGYCMPLLTKRHVKLVDIVDAKARKASGLGHWDWGARLIICHNLAQGIASLHAGNAACGDLNEENAVVDERGLVSLLDMDSISFRSPDGTLYPGAGIARDDWRPPEYGPQATYTVEGDNWALAVQIYMLLMESTRPYSTRGSGMLPGDAVRAGTFPILDPQRYHPPKFSPPLDLLPPALQQCFITTFGVGRPHPSKRTPPGVFAEELKAVMANLVRCDDDANHVFADNRQRCPWCERRARINSMPSTSGPHAKQLTLAMAPHPKAAANQAATRRAGAPTPTTPYSNTPRHKQPRGPHAIEQATARALDRVDAALFQLAHRFGLGR